MRPNIVKVTANPRLQNTERQLNRAIIWRVGWEISDNAASSMDGVGDLVRAVSASIIEDNNTVRARIGITER